MKKYQACSKAELETLYNQVLKEYEDEKKKGLNLNMARGKPSKAQLDLSLEMLEIVDEKALENYPIDLRNYGVLDGIEEAKVLMSEMMDVKKEQVIIFGNSSLNIMYDQLMRSFVFGVNGEKPWMRQEKLKWLCPAPGYDRHFSMSEAFGFELIPIQMKENGIDMDEVEKYIQDESVKGIWCVPKFSNPEGVVYSDEVITRLARLKPKAKDFRIYLDNAYCQHYLYDEEIEIKNIFEEAEKYGNSDLIYMFASTSKITFPGSGICAIACSENNKKDILSHMQNQTIGHDKINQLRHVLFLKDKKNIRKHMQKHASIIRPKFEAVLSILEEELGELDIASWTKPRGGYFISFNGPNHTAKKIVEKAKEAGVILTNAGATYPYGKDPLDRNIRIAPTMPTLEEIKEAMHLFTICVRLVTLENLKDKVN